MCEGNASVYVYALHMDVYVNATRLCVYVYIWETFGEIDENAIQRITVYAHNNIEFWQMTVFGCNEIHFASVCVYTLRLMHSIW